MGEWVAAAFAGVPFPLIQPRHRLLRHESQLVANVQFPTFIVGKDIDSGVIIKKVPST